MDYLIAIAHFVGSIVLSIAMGLGYLTIASWYEQKAQDGVVDEVAFHLGLKLDELEDTKHTQDVVAFYSHKFTTESLKNRLSDFFELVQTCWEWIGFFSQLFFLGFIVWLVIRENLDDAVFAWVSIVISLFFFISSLVFSFVTKLCLGRYPGEAKKGRALLVDFIEHQKEKVHKEELFEKYNSSS